MAKIGMTYERGRQLFAAGAAVLLATLLPMLSAQAMLQENYQRMRELDMIATSVEVADRLQGQPIEAIEWVEGSYGALYQVRAGACTLEVQVVLDPESLQNGPGGDAYLLEVGEAACL